MKQYLIINSALDTFASTGDRVLFFPITAFLPAIQPQLSASLNNDTNASLVSIKITNEIQALVCDNPEALLSTPHDVSWLTFRQLILGLPCDTAELLARAIQLIRFHYDHHFCSRCGTGTQPHPIDNATVCPSCQYHQYPRLQPCIITAVIKPSNNAAAVPKILLAHHHRASSSGMYGLIAGFVEVGESLENCVHREVKEEVNLQVTNLRYFSSQPWPFPSNLMVGFIAEYASGDVVIQEEELIHADFFAFDKLPIIPQAGTIAHDLIMAAKARYTL